MIIRNHIPARTKYTEYSLTVGINDGRFERYLKQFLSRGQTIDILMVDQGWIDRTYNGDVSKVSLADVVSVRKLNTNQYQFITYGQRPTKYLDRVAKYLRLDKIPLDDFIYDGVIYRDVRLMVDENFTGFVFYKTKNVYVDAYEGDIKLIFKLPKDYSIRFFKKNPTNGKTNNNP